jgi:membrane protease YdiL (CAAX protease family)
MSESTSLPPPLKLPLSPDSEARPPVSRLRWAIHLAIMAALPVAIGILGNLRQDSGPALGHNVRGLLTASGWELAVFAAVFGLAWLASRATRDDLLLRWRPGYWVVPLGMVYSVAIRVVAGIATFIGIMIFVIVNRGSVAGVNQFVAAHPPQVEALVDVNAMRENPVYYWLLVVVVSLVLGGLREELWRSSFLAGLRALWPRAFGSTGGGIAGAAIAALFFGAGHLPQGMVAVILVTVVGFLLGVIMTLHRSVWPSVVAHGLFDVVSLALIPLVMPHLQQMAHPGG